MYTRQLQLKSFTVDKERSQRAAPWSKLAHLNVDYNREITQSCTLWNEGGMYRSPSVLSVLTRQLISVRVITYLLLLHNAEETRRVACSHGN